MSADLEIQKAIFARLSSMSVPVYDDVPDNAPPPYVVIGDDTLLEFDSDGISGFEATTTIHTWSTYRGRKEVKELQGEIYTLLHRAELAVVGYTFVSCDSEFSESILDADGVTRHGIQRFRILIRE